MKSLQGTTPVLAKSYLQEVEQDIKKIYKIKEKVDKDKKKSLIRQIFVQQTECGGWEEAKEQFPEHTGRLDDFLGYKLLSTLYEVYQN